MIYVPSYGTQASEVIEAMNSEVPMILSENSLLKEYAGDSALFVKPDNFNDVAEKMMLLFKDEQKRKELIEKGKEQLRLFLQIKNRKKIYLKL